MVFKTNKIMPLNISGRSAEEIITTAEATWLSPYLIQPKFMHLDECRCHECIQRKLDEVVRSSNELMDVA